MNFNLFRCSSRFLGFGLLITLLSACLSNEQEGSKTHKYLLLINGEKGSRSADRMLWFDTLDSAAVLETEKGSSIQNLLGAYVILQDSFLLTLNKEKKSLQKYNYTVQGLAADGAINVTGLQYLAYTVKLDSSKLFISGSSAQNNASYVIVDPGKMKLVGTGKLRLPVASGQKANDTFGRLKKNKLYVGYSSFGDDFDHCSDTSYLAVFDYPALQERTIARDTRSAFPGAGVNGVFSSFSNAQNDIYVLTSPVFYHGNHPTAPTAFFRVLNGDTVYDKSYFFNLSAQLQGQHLVGIAQAGPDKVILATMAYPSTGTSDYYVADVKSKKLTLLLKNQVQPNFVWGTSGYWNGAQTLFVVNETQGKSRVYIYDPSLQKLSKGPSITGGVSKNSSYLIFKPTER